MNKKRRTRHVLDWLLTVVIAGSLSLLLFCGWIWYGAFNQSALNDWLSSRGYYETRYEQLIGEMDACLEYLEIPKECLDLKDVHTKFLIASKKEIFQQQDIKRQGQEIQAIIDWNIGSEIRTQLEQYLKEQDLTLTEDAKKGMEELELFLDQAFVQYTKNPELEEWSLRRDMLQKGIIQKSIVFGIICLSGVLVLFAIQHRKSFAWKYLGIGIATAGLSVLIRSIYGTLSNVADGNFLEQVYQKNGYSIGSIIFLAGIGITVIPWLLNDKSQTRKGFKRRQR